MVIFIKFLENKKNLLKLEDFFKLHSSATERKKDKKWVQKANFLAN